jgi:hypothetical protein
LLLAYGAPGLISVHLPSLFEAPLICNFRPHPLG